MSEFLIRGWNVAIPEVDIGDDIFVVQDKEGTLRRVQVKTSTSKATKTSYSAHFNLPFNQLKNIGNIPIHYVFIVRHNNEWEKPIIIRQDYLLDYWQQSNIGSFSNHNLNLHISYGNRTAKCSKIDFTKYISDFTDFPIVK